MPLPNSYLHLRELEGRSLPSIGAWPTGPVVVTGTDAHDVITLASHEGDRVTVTVRSFLDPEWTQPTGDPDREYEIRVGFGTLAPTWAAGNGLGLVPLDTTTGTILVDAGAGHDRIDTIDITKGFFVSGTRRTEEPAAREVPVPVDMAGIELPRIPALEWRDEVGGRWAMSADVFTMEWRPFYTDTLVEGDYMDDGAIIGVRFPDLPWDLPAPDETWPDEWVLEDEPADGPTGGEVQGQLASGEGLDLLTGEGWPPEDAEAGWEGGADMGWSTNEPGLSDLWVEWADDLPTDWIEGEADYGPDGADALVEEDLGEWLETDLESEDG